MWLTLFRLAGATAILFLIVRVVFKIKFLEDNELAILGCLFGLAFFACELIDSFRKRH